MSLVDEMARAADSWLGSLSAEQLEYAQYPGPGQDDAERTAWFYTPTDHGGLPLGQQRPRQQGLAMRLLATGLSPGGYAVAATVMGLENVLDRMESWTRDWGRERGRDPGLYYFRVFGSPADGVWGWRCGGHHLSVNYTIVDGLAASCTPCFIGAHPAETALPAGGTLKPLGNIESAARDLARDLEQRGQAGFLLHPSAISDIVSGNRALVRDGDEMIHMQDLWRGKFAESRLNTLLDHVDADAEAASGYGPADHRALALTRQPKGIRADALTPAEQARLLELVAGYLDRFPAEIADPWLAGYRTGALDGLYFGYAGERAHRGPVYYRIQDQRLLVEYDNTQYNANHAHSVTRDLTADFGIDPLARHWRDSRTPALARSGGNYRLARAHGATSGANIGRRGFAV